MNQNYLDILYKIVRHRVFQIECEISLLKNQYSFLLTLPKINQENYAILQPKIGILTAVSTMYKCYLSELQRFISQYSICPLKRAIQCHLLIVTSPDSESIQNSNASERKKRQEENARRRKIFDECKMEIKGHQDAIKEKLGNNYFSNCDSIEKLFEGLYYLFPYHEIIDLMCSPTQQYFSNLFKIALAFEPSEESHLQCLRNIYGMLSEGLPGFNKPAILAISEILLGIFTFKIVDQKIEDNIKCFQFFECCKLLVKCNLSQISIKSEMIARIERNMGFSPTDSSQTDYIVYENEKPLDDANSALFKKEQFEYVDDKKSPIMCLHHIVLELRKMPLQPSVSLMCFILIRTLELLNAALSDNGEMVGSDESFQFFVASLADARLYRLPTLLTHLEKYLISDLRFGKISFLISQLRCASDFILTRKLAVPPYILFPFKLDNIKALTLVTNRELMAYEKEIQKLSEHEENDSAKPLYDPDDSQSLELSCFAVYAFPHFLRSSGQIPAVLHCNGDNRNKVSVYRYRLSDQANAVELLNNDLVSQFSTIGTVHGTLYYMPQRQDYDGLILLKNDHKVKLKSNSNTEQNSQKDLEKVDQKDIRFEQGNQNYENEKNNEMSLSYNDHMKEICELSNLMLMIPDNFISPVQKLNRNKFNYILTPSKKLITFGGYCYHPELLVLPNLPKFEMNFKKSWYRIVSLNDGTKSQQMKTNENVNIESSQNYESTFPIIMDLQTLLKQKGILPEDYQISGCLDKETILAIVRDNPFDHLVMDQKSYINLKQLIKKM